MATEATNRPHLSWCVQIPTFWHVKTSSRWLKPTRVMPQRTYRKCQELEQCWFIRPAWRSNTHQFRLHHVPNRLFSDDEGIDIDVLLSENWGCFEIFPLELGMATAHFQVPLRSRWDVQQSMTTGMLRKWDDQPWCFCCGTYVFPAEDRSRGQRFGHGFPISISEVSSKPHRPQQLGNILFGEGGPIMFYFVHSQFQVVING